VWVLLRVTSAVFENSREKLACFRCKKREALKRQRLKDSEDSDNCFAGSCTIKDMIDQSSGSGSGLPLLVSVFSCIDFIKKHPLL